MPRSESSDSESEAERRERKKQKKSKFADPEDIVVADFLTSIERNEDPAPPPPPPAPTGRGTGAPPPQHQQPVKPPPPLYFDVKRSAAEKDDLVGRLDLSGAQQLTFGRDATRADIPLDHPSISRHHATMTFDRQNAFIADIRSTHGTFIKRKAGGEETRLKPAELTQLAPGDVVRFGESSRIYEFGVAAQQPRLAVPTPIPTAPGASTHACTSCFLSLGNGLVQVDVTIPKDAIKRLTGLQGRALQQIQARTGAQLNLVLPQEKGSAARGGGESTLGAKCVVKGDMDSVAAARLELLAITQLKAPAAFSATSGAGTQRFRYSSTIVHGTGDDDDLHESGTAKRRVW